VIQKTLISDFEVKVRAADEAFMPLSRRGGAFSAKRGKHRQVIFMAHDHKYAIADGEAVLGGGTRHRRREKLLRALDEASQRYQNTSHKERQAFFHGLLTGYAVALKLLYSFRALYLEVTTR